MAKRLAIAGTAAVALLLFSGTVLLGRTGVGPLTAQVASGSVTVLDSCGRIDTLFPLDDGDQSTNPVQGWAAIYHETVAGVLEQHLHPRAERLECKGDPRYEASENLQTLAALLHPWKGDAQLAERDMAAVLLTYLRAYECALEERRQDLFYHVTQDAIHNDAHFLYDTDEGGDDESLSAILDETTKELLLISREQKESRPALRRTLQYLSGHDRLRPLEQNLQCLERVSLEIRNILSLAADTASCLPRATGARDPLRDL